MTVQERLQAIARAEIQQALKDACNAAIEASCAIQEATVSDVAAAFVTELRTCADSYRRRLEQSLGTPRDATLQ